MPQKTRRCAFYTLGCKVNQYDTESLARLFRERGYDIVDFESLADVYCINTCTVTSTSEKKSRQAIRRAKRRNPSAIVAVVGCYAQVAPDEVASIPGVDVVAGIRERGKLVDLVEKAMQGQGPVVEVRGGRPGGPFEELPLAGPHARTRGFIKVQEGCDEFCSYCRVPYARGASRSRDPESVLAEVQRFVEAGHKEIVLTGIHLGAYGRDLGELGNGVRPDLAWLVERVHEVPGLGRVRLSSVEPLDVDERLIRAVAALPRVAKHFHIPLQSGDDDILAMMNRRYRASDYERLIDRIREEIWPVGITTDIMVGFPGETEERFARSCEFARRIAFSRMHVFAYSPRPGTRAARMKAQVDPATRHARSETMIALGRELGLKFHQSLVGCREEALVEDYEVGRGVVRGIGSTYVRIEFPGEADLAGELVPVSVVAADPDGVTARRVFQPEVAEEGSERRGEKL
ncbi:MAG: tRNA (N(6)-L-threonylcarbamoyladenosine(37)-C(2))-methylthiotransferase MtaB [Firmicutes bacterium]|nr:tRNA (N(6)-L-threonylcarbamoyladenosine(37)-C(2))-methylthiotransferase MtaB [Bacillota bacterium]